MSNTTLEQKRELRERIKAWRREVAPDFKLRAAMAVAASDLRFLSRPLDGAVISGFAPLADEFRIWPLLRRLAAANVQLALPVMQGKNRPLLFRAWKPGDLTDAGVWGIAEPKADKPPLQPDVLLVPLLAFDVEGRRLGYGGGFYDRTLRDLRARKAVVAVGIAFDEQRVDRVPHLDYDERLDWVLTPSGAIRCVG